MRAPRPPVSGALLVAVALLVVAVDVATPASADSGLYALPLLFGMRGRPARHAVMGAALLSALAVVTGAFTIGTTPVAVVAWNRAIALAVIWAAALERVRSQRLLNALDARTKDLADVKFAIDQSAIVAVTDARGRITDVNDTFCAISQYTRDELLGQDHRILNSGLHPKEFFADLWRTIRSGRIWHGELRNRAKDGSYYWVDTTVVPFLDPQGVPYQYMALRYEITARKRSEAALREQQALATLGQMAAVVAHEVKNPIAGIRGALQVIGSRMAPTDDHTRVIGEIIARLDALNGIVNDLLVFARPREPRAEPVDLAGLVHRVIDLLTRDPQMADLQVEAPTTSAQVPGDPEQLQLALSNLLMNAAQAQGCAGRVTVALRPTVDDGWDIVVTDEGPGMPPEVRARIFEPFFTTKTRGTGLGLPIARRIVEAHGGRLEIAPGPTRGTVATLHLPGRR